MNLELLEFVTVSGKTYLGEVELGINVFCLTVRNAVEWDTILVPYLDAQRGQAGAVPHVNIGKIGRVFTSTPAVAVAGTYTRIRVADFNEEDQKKILEQYKTASAAPAPRVVDTNGGGPRIVLPGRA